MPDPAAQGAEERLGPLTWPAKMERVWDEDGVTCDAEFEVVPLSRAQGAEERRFPGQDQPGVWVLYRRERDAWWRVRWSDTPRLGANGLEVIEVVPLSRAQEAEAAYDELRARLEAVEEALRELLDVLHREGITLKWKNRVKRARAILSRRSTQPPKRPK